MGNIREDLNDLDSCGLASALEAVGERWSFMILRAAFNGLQHFEEFQSELGIARNILASRLARLVEKGIMQRQALDSDRRKVVYTLTEKGAGLLPAMVALRQWGECWCHGVASPVLVDDRDEQPIRPVTLLSHDGRPLDLHDLRWKHADELVELAGRREVRA